MLVSLIDLPWEPTTDMEHPSMARSESTGGRGGADVPGAMSPAAGGQVPEALVPAHQRAEREARLLARKVALVQRQRQLLQREKQLKEEWLVLHEIHISMEEDALGSREIQVATGEDARDPPAEYRARPNTQEEGSQDRLCAMEQKRILIDLHIKELETALAAHVTSLEDLLTTLTATERDRLSGARGPPRRYRRLQRKVETRERRLLEV